MSKRSISTLALLAATLLCGSAAAEKDCVPLGSTAPAWDHVTTCKDWYAVLTNGDARVADDAAASVPLSGVDASAATSLEACATLCFETNKCQWFKFGRECALFQHLALRQSTGGARPATTQFGFLLSGDADYLNQNVQSSSQHFSLGGVSFYRTTDASTGQTISMYLPSADAKCVSAAPLTLFRAYHNNYETASMAAKAASGETINAMDQFFTLERFLLALQPSANATIAVPTDAVDITSSGDVVRTGAAGSTYTYKLDRFGRVVDVSARMNFTNVLRKPGRPSENRKGVSIRSQYCANAYQQRYNVVQMLQEATSAKLAFQAGHLMGCQFSNPHGFFNFVPQAAKSNAMNGCWYNTELGTSALLKMGCEGVFRARLTYLSTPGDLAEVSSLTGPLLSPSDAAAIYTTAAGASNALVQRPCGYWYRPIKMSLDFTITGASSGSRCSVASSVLRDNQGKFFTTDAATTGGMRVSRAFAQWAFDSAAFNRLRGMGAADWRANQCYAETGKLVPELAFDNSFDRVLLRLKSSGSAPPQCVAVVNGALELSSCDAAAASLRWTGASVSGSSDSVTLTNGASPSCIATRSSPATCLSLRFQYAKLSVTFSGNKANIKTADELVDGTVLATPSQCLAVSGTTLTLRPSGSSDCAVLQATYVLDDGVDSGDDE